MLVGNVGSLFWLEETAIVTQRADFLGTRNPDSPFDLATAAHSHEPPEVVSQVQRARLYVQCAAQHQHLMTPVPGKLLPKFLGKRSHPTLATSNATLMIYDLKMTCAVQ